MDAVLFDVYVGDPVPPGKRSLAFRLSYRDPERTLTDDLVNPHHQALVAALEKIWGRNCVRFRRREVKRIPPLGLIFFDRTGY